MATTESPDFILPETTLEELFDGVPQEAEDQLLLDTVFRIEEEFHYIESLKSLSESKNPFDTTDEIRDSNDLINLSFLYPSERELVKGRRPQKGRRHHVSRGMKTKIFTGNKRFFAAITREFVEKNGGVVSEGFETLDEARERLSKAFDSAAAREEIPTEMVGETLRKLTVLAENLPTKQALQLMQKVSSFISESCRDLSRKGIRLNISMIYPSSGGPVERTLAGTEVESEVTRLSQALVDISTEGSDTYEYFRGVIDSEISRRVSIAGGILFGAKLSLSGETEVPDPEKKRKLLVIEDYIAARGAQLNDLLTHGTNHQLEGVIKDLMETPLRRAESIKAVQAQELHESKREEIAQGLSKRVACANRILAGGKHLPPHESSSSITQMRIDTLAQYLHTEFDGSDKSGSRQLEVNEYGVIVAIVAGRFPEFLETLDILKDPSNSLDATAAKIVEEDKGKSLIVQTLKSYDLAKVMEKLEKQVIENSKGRDKLTDALTEREHELVERTITEFMGLIKAEAAFRAIRESRTN